MKSVFKSGLKSGLKSGTLCITFAVAALTAASAQAVDAKAWAGGLLGLTVPSANGTTSRSQYGLTAGAKVGTELGVGVYYLSSQKTEDGIGAYNFDLYGAQVGYHFEGEADGVFIAGRIGTSKVGPNNLSPMNIGVVAGYDYLLSEHLSLGGEVSYMSIAASGNQGGFTTLGFLAALKLWL